MSQAFSSVAGRDQEGLGIGLVLKGVCDGATLGTLAAQLASSITELEPATRMLIAQRLLAYTSDLLVRPLSAAGGRILDDANARLTGLDGRDLHAAANDR